MTLLVKDANTTTQSISTQSDVAGSLVPVHAPAVIVGGIATPVGPTSPLPVINSAGNACNRRQRHRGDGRHGPDAVWGRRAGQWVSRCQQLFCHSLRLGCRCCKRRRRIDSGWGKRRFHDAVGLQAVWSYQSLRQCHRAGLCGAEMVMVFPIIASAAQLGAILPMIAGAVVSFWLVVTTAAMIPARAKLSSIYAVRGPAVSQHRNPHQPRSSRQ